METPVTLVATLLAHNPNYRVLLLLNEIKHAMIHGSEEVDQYAILSTGKQGALADLVQTRSLSFAKQVGRGQYAFANGYGAEVRFTGEKDMFSIRFMVVVYGNQLKRITNNQTTRGLHIMDVFGDCGSDCGDNNDEDYGEVVYVHFDYVDLMLDHIRNYPQLVASDEYTWSMIQRSLGDVGSLFGQWIAPRLWEFHNETDCTPTVCVNFARINSELHHVKFEVTRLEWAPGYFYPCEPTHYGSPTTIIGSTTNIFNTLKAVRDTIR